MKNYIVSVTALSLIMIGSFSLIAQEKGGKKDPAANLVTQFIKQLEKAELTADQTTKVKEIYTKAATEVSAKRTAGGISTDMLKKRLDASKAAKEAGKKGKDMAAAVTAAMGMTPEQAKLYEETDVTLSKARIEIGKLLTPEQIAKLPEAAQASLKEKAGGKGKKAAK